MRKLIRIALMVSCMALASNVFAASVDHEQFICGQKQITLGMAIEKARLDCGPFGQPDFISEHSRPNRKVSNELDNHFDIYEKWLYKSPINGDTHILFKNGQVIRIFNILPN